MIEIQVKPGKCDQHNHICIDTPCPYPGCPNGVLIDDGVPFNAVAKNGFKYPLKRVSWESPTRGEVYAWYELAHDDPHDFLRCGTYRPEAFNVRQPELDNPIIYHYTDQTGLEGILNGSNLWMTDHRHLNDTGEVQFGLQQLQQVLAEFEDTFSSSEDLKKIYDLLSGETIRFSPMYVTCFSNNGDNLTMWRSYADEGKGFAIGLARKTFIGADYLELKGVERGTCVYAPEKQRQIFRTLIQTFLSLKKLFDQQHHASFLPKRQANEFLQECLSSILTMKHHAFACEEEFRMVATLYNQDNVKLRQSHDQQIPYINTQGIFDIMPYPKEGTKFSRGELLFSKPTFFIQEIVVGPNKDSVAMKGWLEEKLIELGLETTCVRQSTIPFNSLKGQRASQ